MMYGKMTNHQLIWLIAKKEFLLNLISSRFMIGFLLCVFIVPFTVIVSIDRYENQLQSYLIDQKKTEERNKSVRVYSQIRPEIVIEPEPLSIFSHGISSNIGNRLKIMLGEYPLFPSGHVATRDNPLLNAFFSIDFTRVIAILMSLLAFVFSYDAFTRESEGGTLKLVFTNKIGRITFFSGKLLGIILTLFPVLIFCFLLNFLIIALSPAVQLTASDWSGITILFVASLLYMVVFILLGMLVSSRTARSSTSIVICLIAWSWLLFLVPNIATYLSRSIIKTEMYDNMQIVLNKLNETFEKEEDERAGKIYKDLGIHNLSYWYYSGDGDGTLVIGVVSEGGYEYNRRLNALNEPERIYNADKKWTIQKKYLDDLTHQEKVRQYISFLSPSGLFEQIAEISCHTASESFLKYMTHVREYRQSIIRYFTDKNLFASYAYFTPLSENIFPKNEDMDRGDNHQEWSPYNYPYLDLGDVPVFSYKSSVYHVVNELMMLFIGMFGICILLISLTIVSLTSYRIR